MLAALGFYHMQSSSDRDDYVRINWDGIIDNQKHNFNKFNTSVVTGFNVTYDYGSLMHYSAYAFSKNGVATIIPHVIAIEFPLSA